MKYGARVYFYDGGVVHVIQTVRREGKGAYVLDCDRSGNPKQEHVNPGEDQDGRLSAAVRRAGCGELTTAQKSEKIRGGKGQS